MIFDFQCALCKLASGRTVPGEGPTTPKLIVISDYPGAIEHKERKPLAGTSGQLLRKALTNVVGISPADVFFTNVIKCWPDSKRKRGDPDDKKEEVGKRELTLCRKWLNKELGMVKAPIILLAGDKARQVMLPHVDAPLGKIHGRVYKDPMNGWKMLVTWNPATIEQFSPRTLSGNRVIMEGSAPWMFMNDMKKLKALLEAEYG